MAANTSAQTGWLTVGELAARAEVAPSAVRFYDKHGLVHGIRTAGNQRRFHGVEACLIKIIRVAQRAGLTVAEIRDLLAELPRDRDEVDLEDYLRLKRALENEAQQRIRALNQVLADLADEPELCKSRR